MSQRCFQWRSRQAEIRRVFLDAVEGLLQDCEIKLFLVPEIIISRPRCSRRRDGIISGPAALSPPRRTPRPLRPASSGG